MCIPKDRPLPVFIFFIECFVTKFHFLRYPGERREKMDFEKAYERYFQNVYRYVCSMTGDRNLAEEVSQETFL